MIKFYISLGKSFLHLHLSSVVHCSDRERTKGWSLSRSLRDWIWTSTHASLVLSLPVCETLVCVSYQRL